MPRDGPVDLADDVGQLSSYPLDQLTPVVLGGARALSLDGPADLVVAGRVVGEGLSAETGPVVPHPLMG